MGAIELAKRAVACKAWRWMPGMQTTEGMRVIGVLGGGRPIISSTAGTCVADLPGLPDLTDPATLGCLLALVREAWGSPGAYAEHDACYARHGASWFVWTRIDAGIGSHGRTEAESLVAALEAAP